MFIGRYYHRLEDKGRISLPKIFRSQTQKWIITRGLDGGLFLFKETDFAEQVTGRLPRTLTKKADRDWRRLMVNSAAVVIPDRLGRVMVPDYLIQLANLTKEVVVVGSQSYLEIWDRQRYHQYLAQLDSRAE